jgi:hypothetical protein
VPASRPWGTAGDTPLLPLLAGAVRVSEALTLELSCYAARGWIGREGQQAAIARAERSIPDLTAVLAPGAGLTLHRSGRRR